MPRAILIASQEVCSISRTKCFNIHLITFFHQVRVLREHLHDMNAVHLNQSAIDLRVVYGLFTFFNTTEFPALKSRRVPISCFYVNHVIECRFFRLQTYINNVATILWIRYELIE